MSDLDLMAWEFSDPGCCVTGTVCAKTRGRARYLTALSAVDAGFYRCVGDALKSIRFIRASWADVDALSRGRDGFLGHIAEPCAADCEAAGGIEG